MNPRTFAVSLLRPPLTRRVLTAWLAVIFGVLPLSRAHADEDDPIWLNVGASVESGESDGRAVFAELGFAWDGAPHAPAKLALSDGSAAVLASAHPALPVTPSVVKSAVLAAYRAAHLLSEETIDSMASRARWRGLVPDIHLRAMRLWDDSAKLDLTAAESDWRTTDLAHANLWLEARASFRLERLMFASEELGVARFRLLQSTAAQRLALRVVSTLSLWQRLWLENRAAPRDSAPAFEASLRMAEVEHLLDVMTSGWFSAWRSHQEP